MLIFLSIYPKAGGPAYRILGRMVLWYKYSSIDSNIPSLFIPQLVRYSIHALYSVFLHAHALIITPSYSFLHTNVL